MGKDCLASILNCNDHDNAIFGDPNDPDADCRLIDESNPGAGTRGCMMTVAEACPCTCRTCECESPDDKERTPGYGCRLPIA